MFSVAYDELCTIETIEVYGDEILSAWQKGINVEFVDSEIRITLNTFL